MNSAKPIVSAIAAFAVALSANGATTTLRLDTRTTPIVADTIDITWDSSWIGCDAGATVVIRDNGTEVKRTTGVGAFTYTPTMVGRHELTYTTYLGGRAQEDIYQATIYKGKYAIHFDANGGEGTMPDCEIVAGMPFPRNTFTKDGNFLLGWALTPDGVATLLDGDTMEDILAEEGETVTLYAVWHEGTESSGINGLSLRYYDISSSGYSTWTQSEAAMTNYFAAYTPTIETNTLDWGETLDAGFAGDIGSTGDRWVSAGLTRPTSSVCRFSGKYASKGTERFAIHISGKLRIGATGTYQFAAVADDSIVLYVNGTKILWNDEGWVNVGFGEIALSAGMYSIAAGFFETDGGQGLSIQWKKPGDSSYAPIPQSFLFDGNPTYAVRFDANGGEGTMEKRVYAAGEDVALPANAFLRSGWTFSGWGTETDGPVEYADGEVIKGGMGAANGQIASLYAVWSPNHYQIHFNNGGGTGSMTNQSCAYNVEAELSSNMFTRTGYTFSGWATEPGGDTVYDDGDAVLNLASVDGTVFDLFAKWTPNRYSVCFDANGGVGTMAPQPFAYDEEQALASNIFVRANRIFAGWATTADGEVACADGAVLSNLTADVDGEVTLHAVWADSRVVFNVNGGEGEMDPFYLFSGEEQALPHGIFTKEGHFLLGWALTPDGAATLLDGDTMEDILAEEGETVTLYAVWHEGNGSTGTYAVRFDANGGTGTMEKRVYAAGEDVALPANAFLRSGWTFAGWGRKADGPVLYADGERIGGGLAAASGQTVTLHAVWKAGGFTYTVSDGEVEITGFDGGEDDWGEIVIPESLGGLPVTSIGDDAFRSHTNLTSVSIPGSVRRIGYGAFCYCENLTSATIMEGVASLGAYAFYDCEELTAVAIPNSVTNIGDSAFGGYSKIASFTVGIDNPNYTSINGLLLSKDGKTVLSGVVGDVTIPDGVTEIGATAFARRYNLKSVVIPNSVTNIGDYAFCDCWDLTHCTIPYGVERIGNGAFAESGLLGEITIPNSVSSIGNGAFLGCGWLTSVTIPDSVTSIGYSMFEDCMGLTSVTIPNSVTNIESCAFYACENLASITIPDSVTIIGYLAFCECQSLASVTIPESVEKIVTWAFYGCTNLATIVIPQNCEVEEGAIPEWTTIGRPGDVFVSLDGGGGTVDAEIFAATPGKRYGNISCNRLERTGYSFSGWTVDGETVGSASICTRTTNHVLTARWTPNQYTVSFGRTALAPSGAEFAAVGSANAPGGIAIGALASKTVTFDSAYGELPVATAAGYDFERWTFAGEEVTAETICTIPSNHVLTAVMAPKEYTVTFDANGGEVAPSSKIVTFNETYGALPVADSFQWHSFRRWLLDGSPVEAETVVSTPDDHTLVADWNIGFGGGVWEYPAGDGPISLGMPLVEPSGEVEIPAEIDGRPVVEIGADAFAGNAAITSISIPASVTNIAEGAFAGCSRLRSVSVISTMRESRLSDVFPDAIGSIESVAFVDGVETIPDNYFEGCTALRAMDIAESVVEIGTNVFEACSALATTATNGLVFYQGWCLGYAEVGNTPPGGSAATPLPEGGNLFADLVIPEEYEGAARSESAPSQTQGYTVRGIAAGAFRDEWGIATAAFPETLRFIGAGAFENCTGLEDVSVPTNVWKIDRDAFRNCTYAQDLALPEGALRAIGDGAFANCSSLMGLALPNGLESIGEAAFSNGWRMLSVTIPQSVERVGDGAFADCRRVAGATVPIHVRPMAELFPAAYDKIEVAAADGRVVDVSVPEGEDAAAVASRRMVPGMFAGCAALEEVALPGWLGSVSAGAFEGCASLESVVIPASVTNIESSAFASCSALSSVAMPNTLETIGDGAFRDCESLAEITMPESVRALGNGIFDGCGDLVAVRFVGNAPSHSTANGGPYAGAAAALVSYVANGSTGWDGIPTSRALPEYWPDGTTHEIAFWTPNRFVVTFDPGDGTGGSMEIEQVTGTSCVLPPDPARRGARFDGWWTAPENGARVTASTQVTATRPYTVYGHWTMNRYVILFDANGGSGESEPMEMPVGATAALPQCRFSMPGRDFEGWARTPDGPVAFSDGATVSDLSFDDGAVVTLYASWSTREWTLADYLDARELDFTTGGGGEWERDLEDWTAGGASLRSGALPAADEGRTTNTLLRTTVTGAGTLSFWWKVSCEPEDADYDEWYDFATFAVDGLDVARIAGESGWRRVECAVAGEGTHSLEWTFCRDDYDEDGTDYDNALWVDGVEWTPEPKVWTLAEAVDAGALVFATGETGAWTVDESSGWTNGISAKSGAVANGELSWIETTVEGAGTLAFRWNVMGGIYRGNPYAYAKVEIDGENAAQTHLTDGWEGQTLEVAGEGTHTVRWTYLRTSARACDGDCARLDGVAWEPASGGGAAETPEISGDDGATVTGDAESGFVIQPSESNTAVEVVVPQGTDPALVTVEVGTAVETVKPNGATVKVVKGGHDITPWLDIPEADANGVVAVGQANVKQSVADESLDPEEGASFTMTGAGPVLVTSATKPGLTYTLVEGTTLDTMVDGAVKQGDGESWTPVLTVKGGNSGFYRIKVEK